MDRSELDAIRSRLDRVDFIGRQTALELLAEIERLRVFADVALLPPRPVHVTVIEAEDRDGWRRWQNTP
jgi:hypothetical protein